MLPAQHRTAQHRTTQPETGWNETPEGPGRAPGRSLAGGFRLGAWRVEPATHRIVRDGAAVHLEPKVMAVLVLLAERAGEVVDKDAIIGTVWPDTVVSEVSVPRSISELRRALEDDAREPTYVETIPTRGYRLIAAVEAGPGPETDRPPPAGRRTVPPRAAGKGLRARRVALAGLLVAVTAAAVGAIQSFTSSTPAADAIRSLAVLPLRNLSDRAEEEYFADAMTDLLITDLAKLGRFRVISSTSTLRYKGERQPLPEIARELSVDAIVEGSVLRADDRVRITVQLIDGARDKHLWADSYERRLDDVLALQSDVARAIAAHIGASLAPGELARLDRPRQVEPEAYDLYLKGRQLWRRRGVEALQQAAEYFERSIDRDPANALAYAGLSDVYIVQVANGLLRAEAGAPRARRAALKALRLDDRVAEAHVSLAMIRHFFEWDSYSAEVHFQRGLELNPGYATGRQWYAMFLASRGRFDEAVAEAELARELDPLTAQNHVNLSRVFLYSGLYREAVEALERAAHLDGRCRESAELARAEVLALEDATPRRREHLARLFLNQHEDCGESAGNGGEEVPASCTGHHYSDALRHAVLGDRDRALEALDRSLRAREVWLLYAAVEPFFRSLRRDPRFLELIAEVDLEGIAPAGAGRRGAFGETTAFPGP